MVPHEATLVTGTVPGIPENAVAATVYLRCNALDTFPSRLDFQQGEDTYTADVVTMKVGPQINAVDAPSVYDYPPDEVGEDYYRNTPDSEPLNFVPKAEPREYQLVLIFAEAVADAIVSALVFIHGPLMKRPAPDGPTRVYERHVG